MHVLYIRIIRYNIIIRREAAFPASSDDLVFIHVRDYMYLKNVGVRAEACTSQ